ncbi:MAG: site-specific integrase [Holosporaceae bacterium]|jgi:integrase|nr:site-specific integrase [Holosporaceae bacterium]
MTITWIKVKNVKGLRYYEHSTRIYKKRKDRNFSLTYKIGGQTKTESLGWESDGWTIEKASVIMNELKQNQKTGQGPRTLAEKREAAKKQEKLEKQEHQKSALFRDVFRQYIGRVKKDESEKSYTRKLGLFQKWIEPIFQDIELEAIKPTLVESVKDNMVSNGQSERSIQYALSTITLTFKYAKSIELTECESPAAKIKTPKKDNKRERFLTKKEADLLLDELKKTSEQLYDISLLSLYCGLRAGEIFKLEWQDANFDSNRLFIKDRKNGGNASLPMHDKVREMLLRRQETDNTGYVFKSTKGTKITEISNAFTRAVERLGFNKNISDPRQKAVFHTLRHTYASWLVMSDIDLYTVQRLMGHKDITMTQRYAHLAPEHLDKAVSVLR